MVYFVIWLPIGIINSIFQSNDFDYCGPKNKLVVSEQNDCIKKNSTILN